MVQDGLMMTNERRIRVRLAELAEGCRVGIIASQKLIGKKFKEGYTFLHDSISYENSVETFPYIHRGQILCKEECSKVVWDPHRATCSFSGPLNSPPM